MRLTIERIRILVLAAAVLMLLVVAAFLAVGKWRNPLNRRDLPKRLGIEIQQESNGVTYTQAHGGHTLFKIHASKVVQLRQGNAVLHDVKIELYGADGTRVDRIEGSEFEYDQKTGTAKAAGLVDITLMQPGVAPAVAPKAATSGLASNQDKEKPLAAAAETISRGEIHVKTSGLTFDQNSGIATTSQKVDFTSVQGNGSSMGATYDSSQGLLVLEHSVQLITKRGNESVVLHSQHAEFERDNLLCRMLGVTADYRNGEATAAEAKILFRDDGSAVRLDAGKGFAITTETGGHLAAPTGVIEFDEHNHPQHGHLEGGVTMDAVSASPSTGLHRQMHGSSPVAELEFTRLGQLSRAHLQRGVEMQSDEVSASAGGQLRVSRKWRAPVTEIDFRANARGRNGSGQLQVATLLGSEGVVVTGESQRGAGAVSPYKLMADKLTGAFGPASQLTAMTGVGRVSLEQTAVNGSRQSTTGDRIQAQFIDTATAGAKSAVKAGASSGSLASAAQVSSAMVEGHVVLTQYPAPSAQRGANSQSAVPMRATAGRALYDGQEEWLHLTVNPRVEDGGMQLTADKVDFSEASGDAFAHGNVKASWFGNGTNSRQGVKSGAKTGAANMNSSGQTTTHAVANEAQLSRTTGEATFRGQARLWQQTNSIAAPVILLDQNRKSLTAHSNSPAEPVRVTLLSSGSSMQGSKAGKGSANPSANAGEKKSSGGSLTSSVIRLRGGDFWYSDAEHKALMQGSPLGALTAQTGTAESQSDEMELLLNQGSTGVSEGGTVPVGSQVERIVAKGHVIVTSMGRRGTGEQLVYTGKTGEYVLTGTASAPPRMTDPERGSVTGAALVFHGSDESISVESNGTKTVTETRNSR